MANRCRQDRRYDLLLLTKQLSKGYSKKEYQEQSTKELVKMAQDNAVILTMEALIRFEQVLFNTCAEILSFVEEIGNPNCDILVDSFHMTLRKTCCQMQLDLHMVNYENYSIETLSRAHNRTGFSCGVVELDQ